MTGDVVWPGTSWTSTPTITDGLSSPRHISDPNYMIHRRAVLRNAGPLTCPSDDCAACRAEAAADPCADTAYIGAHRA